MIDSSSDHDAHRLEYQRDLLASVLDIVHFMEELQQSLVAVRVLGDTSRLVPAFVSRTYDHLDSHLKSADNTRLHGYQENLEALIRQDLTRVLRIAGADRRAGSRTGEPPAARPPDADRRLVEEFRRRALTLVALRILMRKRGQPVVAVSLPVPERLLEETLQRVEHDCCVHRKRALDEAMVLADEVRVQLRKPALGDAMRRMLAGLQEGLQMNIEHLQSGKPVSDLPVRMESAELHDVAWRGSKPGGGGRTFDTQAVLEDAKQAPAAADSFSQPATLAADAVPGRGVLARIWIYVTTPPDVNWKRTATYQRPRRK